MSRKLLVTSALPYANGSIHLGHMVETIQTDIWVRFQKSKGHHCVYLCADDAHGTPIMLSAKRQGISPETLIERVHAEHQKDFKDFLIDFDCFYTTHSPENEALSAHIFEVSKQAGAIEEREIEQAFCPSCQIFLPDRFIKGECPFCHAPDQYGDACEKCAKTYDALQLIAPFCVECGTSPIRKNSVHYFFKLSQFETEIKTWMATHVPQEVQNKMEEWFKQGLQDWDISRDAPYFGFLIPGTTDKYFYVWVDAPVGYMAATQKWAEALGVSFDEVWKKEGYEVHHFIGKDILYFHTLFWPAMLLASGFKLPQAIHVHGFLTVNGEKMSKSRGTFINARTYLDVLDPQYFRYYVASKLTPRIEDVDFNLEDFVFKVNADIVNKVVNIASRLGSILHKKLGGKLTTLDPDGRELLLGWKDSLKEIDHLFDTLEYASALRLTMVLAESANKYIDAKAPWGLVQTSPDQAAQVCTAGLNMFKVLMGILQPILPQIAEKSAEFLTVPSAQLSSLDMLLEDHEIQPYVHLAQRLELKAVQALVSDPRVSE